MAVEGRDCPGLDLAWRKLRKCEVVRGDSGKKSDEELERMHADGKAEKIGLEITYYVVEGTQMVSAMMNRELISRVVVIL